MKNLLLRYSVFSEQAENDDDQTNVVKIAVTTVAEAREDRGKDMNAKQREELVQVLRTRFEKNMNRHKDIAWAKVQAKLETNTKKLRSLNEMEATGGEPDVIGFDKKADEFIFYDCSAESSRAAEASVTTAKPWSHEKNISQKIAQLIWPPE